MNPRLAAMAALGREAAIPALVLAWIGTSSLAGINNSGAAPVAHAAPVATRAVAERLAPSLAADVKDVKLADIKPVETKVAEKLQLASAAPDFPPPSDLSLSSGPSLASIPATVTAAPETASAPAAREPEPIVTASLTDTSEKLVTDAPPGVAGNTDATSPVVPSQVGTVEVLDECYVIEACVDRYLFALYQRAPKEDTVAVEDKRQVTIKRKGKMVTVTRTSTRRADQDFAWKDPKAAEKAGMTMPQYVIGGMDRDFKMKLFRMLLAAEQAGQYPGITSAFRDDYRQSIASGLKAASDRSYHGGSFRGGYGHGLAADIVSINGATRAQRLTSTQAFWKWVDAHGKDYGVGRPYLDHDPPHVGPTDGKEYADKHPRAAHRAEAAASRQARRAAKRVQTATRS